MRARPIYRLLGLLLMMVVFIFAGCAPAVQIAAPTQSIAPSAAPVTNTPNPTATSVPLPTKTTQPTATQAPTQPPTATAVPESVNAWCLPPKFAGQNIDYVSNPAMPNGANQGTVENGKLNLKVPAVSCTWMFTFSQPVAAGTFIEFYQPKTKDPWSKIPLTPVNGQPNVAVATSTHGYMVDPPYWEITYPYAVVLADGTIKSEGEARIYKALPPLCWNGTLPNPVTLYCPSVDGDWNVGIPETYEHTKH